MKLVAFGYETGEKPYDGELECFDISDLTALGYSRFEAKGLKSKLSNTDQTITSPKPIRKDSYLAPCMAERNNLVRTFLEDDDISTIS